VSLTLYMRSAHGSERASRLAIYCVGVCFRERVARPACLLMRPHLNITLYVNVSDFSEAGVKADTCVATAMASSMADIVRSGSRNIQLSIYRNLDAQLAVGAKPDIGRMSVFG